ncbi:MAG: aminotransferase class III-fold pyridoxal phosphate-dependent enzyme [Dehalococcoidia bacterium]|nr:aminotransferase class III-fold pyridoxal phosphate-dependent enzyme [Dehalococcoidia bacterium]
MSSITERYYQKHPGSVKRYEEAKQLFAGGVTHDTRYTTPFPIYATHAKGPIKWDVDGNEYVDYVSGHGSLILGHSHPAIEEVVARQIGRGTHLGASTDEELRWARAIKDLMPSVEKIRFHSSGTEATLMAFRLARAYTGRDKIIKLEDHFHGWQDYAVATGGGVAGIPDGTLSSMIVLPPNDIPAVERALEGGDVAAVMLEPVGAHTGHMPLMVPQYLDDLRAVTRKHGALLIMDEVVTGFRLSRGGAQVRFGIEPDLSTMAKIVAGGLPGAAVGGKADIIDMIAFRDDPEWDAKRRIAHQGTFNANPLSASTGATALEMIAREPINERADAAAARLKAGFNEVFSKLEVAGHARGLASVVMVTFKDCGCDREVCTMGHSDIKEGSSPKFMGPLKRGMINNGVDPMGRGTFIVSAVHENEHIDRTVAAFEETLKAMREDGVV